MLTDKQKKAIKDAAKEIMEGWYQDVKRFDRGAVFEHDCEKIEVLITKKLGNRIMPQTKAQIEREAEIKADHKWTEAINRTLAERGIDVRLACAKYPIQPMIDVVIDGALDKIEATLKSVRG